MAKTTKATELLKRQSGIDPEMLQIAEHFRIAQMIYDARQVARVAARR